MGKSTLFNRLIKERQAIMDDQSGVTRDRHYGHAFWTEQYFTVIDTGGYVVGSEDVFEDAIREQVEIAMEEATVILFMVDSMSGLTDLDKDFANVVRKSKNPFFWLPIKQKRWNANTPRRSFMSWVWVILILFLRKQATERAIY